MKRVFLALIVLAACGRVLAAVGCTLNDPDRDIKRLFPKATNYKTEFIEIRDRGDKELMKEIEKKLGDKLEPVYEKIDVPYAYYTILSKKEIIGYVHGVNQKGRFGGMQLILATDTDGKILDFYYQKLSSPESKKFRSKEFTVLFKSLSLKDFYTVDLKKKIKDPSKKNSNDYHATLRGLKKNLILLDEFKLKNKYDKYFNKAKKENGKDKDDKSDNAKENENEKNKK